MYFIPRNNAIYNYIAHTNRNRRYGATIFFIILFIGMSFYGIYQPLTKNIIFYTTENTRLRRQHKELKELKHTIQEYTSLMDTSKKRIHDQSIVAEKCQIYCHNRILHMVHTITSNDLILHTYSSCKEKNKDWYSKYSAQFIVEGTLPKLLNFINTLKKEFTMSSISRLVFKLKEKETFQMDFEINFLLVKKINPSTLK